MRPRRPEQVRATRRRLAAAASALLLGAGIAHAQPPQPQVQPEPIAPDLQAALNKADAGSADDLVRLADSGRPDAQTYAGVLFIFGRGSIAKDPARGCAYAEKASASRGDAAYLAGECYRQGLGGAPDPAKAKAAFGRATALGYSKARCALGEMQMAEPAQAAQGLALCKEAGEAGDTDALVTVGDAYFSGRGAPKDHAEARRWYQRAADKKNPQAAHKLGEMYAAGDGGKRDTKKAVELWRTAEAGGDPLVCILVADQLFADMTGGKKPEPGTYAFKGGVPVGDIEVVEQWYREAQDRDPRPDVKKRADYALKILASFKTAAQEVGQAR
jgi:TPR repeat protein